MVISARRLLQYFQLPDKYSRDISEYIRNCLRYLKILIYLLHYFSRNPKWRSVEPYGSVELSLRNTGLRHAA